MRFFINKRTFGLFMLCFLCIFSISAFLITSLYINETNAEESVYTTQISSNAKKNMDYIKRSFSTITTTCNSIFSSRWYNQYRNISNIYTDEFNAIRKKEIQDDIDSKAFTLGFVTDILVITPSTNSIVSRNGWFSLDDYCRIYKTIKIHELENSTDYPTISAVSEDICTMVINDINPRKYKSTICVLISKAQFSTMMDYVKSGDVLYSKATLNGQALYEFGKPEEDTIVMSNSIANPKFTLSLAATSYKQKFLPPRKARYIVTMISILFISILFAIIVTKVVSMPIRKLLFNIDEKNCNYKGDPYRYILNYVDSCLESNRQLRIETGNLNHFIEEFVCQMKNEIMFGLLTDVNFNFEDGHLTTYLPRISVQEPCVLVLIERKFFIDTPYEAIRVQLLNISPQVCTLPIMENRLCILFSLEDKGKDGQVCNSEECREKIEHGIKDLLEDRVHFAISQVISDVKMLRENYLILKEEIVISRQSVTKFGGNISSQTSAINIRQYINDNFCDPNICVNQLGDKFNMHRTLVSKLLKSQFDISFSDYLLNLRMKKSLELLCNTDMTITTIAQTVGYINYATFKRAFVRYQGVTPRDYREQSIITTLNIEMTD